jgi:hypothetical protein
MKLIQSLKEQLTQRIVELAIAEPALTYEQIGKRFGCSEDFVCLAMKAAGRSRKPGPKPRTQVSRGL